MNPILTILYPGGGGGYWLASVLYQLEKNTTLAYTPLINFHYTSRPKNVKLVHTYSPNDINLIYFYGTFYYDVYLNVIHKYYAADKGLKLDNATLESVDVLTLLSKEAFQKITYNKYCNNKIDLNYNLLFLDPAKFSSDLFSILDFYNFNYTKNQDLVLSNINKYKASCVDPNIYYKNLDSPIWVAWCLGILMSLGKFSLFDIENGSCATYPELKNLVANNQDLCCQFTETATYLNTLRARY